MRECVNKLEQREPRGRDERRERDESHPRNLMNEKKDCDRDVSRPRNRRDRDREDDITCKVKIKALAFDSAYDLRFSLTGYHTWITTLSDITCPQSVKSTLLVG